MTQEYDLKQCARCAAWIPRAATMCAYCNTSAPDQPLARPSGLRFTLRRGFSVTSILIAANLVYLVFSLFVQFTWTPKGNPIQYLLTGRGFEQGLEYAGWYDHQLVVNGEWWRVMAATFLHAGAIHIGFNMLALHQLGRMAEDLLGPAKFVTVYLVSGACSTLAISIWFIHVLGQPDHVPMVGASGSVFGIGGLLGVFLLRRGTQIGKAIGMSLVRNLLFMLGLGLLMPFVSNTGHVGGLVPGVLFGLVVQGRSPGRGGSRAGLFWTRLAWICVGVTVVALLLGVQFALRNLGGKK